MVLWGLFYERMHPVHHEGSTFVTQFPPQDPTFKYHDFRGEASAYGFGEEGASVQGNAVRGENGPSMRE